MLVVIGNDYEGGIAFPVALDTEFGNLHTLYDAIQVRTITLHTFCPELSRACLEWTWDMSIVSFAVNLSLYMTPQGPAILVGDLPDNSIAELAKSENCDCDHSPCSLPDSEIMYQTLKSRADRIHRGEC